MKKKIALIVCCLITNLGVFAQKHQFGKVSKDELEERFYPLDSTAEATYLYKSKQVSFDYNIQENRFEKQEEIYIKIKIYNKEGFKYGNQSILFYDLDNGTGDRLYKIKAVTYNLVDGKIEKQQVDKKEIFTERKNKYYSFKKIAFPSLRNGSVIELKYSLVSQFFDIPLFSLQENIPIKKLYYVTSIPEYFTFKKSMKGYYSISPKIETRRGSIAFRGLSARANSASINNQSVIDYYNEITIFEDENILALKNDEPYTSNYNDYRGVICMELATIRNLDGQIKNYSASWKSVCGELYDSYNFGRQLKSKSYFSKDLPLVIAGKETQIKKAEAILDFVKSKVKWNGYYGIYTNDGLVKAYKKGEGNISEVNLILTAMLREAGVNAHPILISTKEHGVPLFPTLDGFNYVIVGVKEGVENISLLDASEAYNTLNVLPTRDLNWKGRMLVNKDINIPVSLIPKQQSEEMYMANVIFDKDFKLSGSIQGKMTHRKALSFRNNYNRLNENKLKEELSTAFNAKLTSCSVKNKRVLAKPVYLSATVSSDNYCETINEKKYINPLLFFKETENPFKLESRKYPVDLIAPYKETKSITISIPREYRVVSMPQSIKFQMSNNLGNYSYLIQKVGNKIIIKSVKEFNTHMIFVNMYAELKQMYKALVAKNKEKIVLEKIESVASAH